MRVLLDECVPEGFRALLAELRVVTIADRADWLAWAPQLRLPRGESGQCFIRHPGVAEVTWSCSAYPKLRCPLRSSPHAGESSFCAPKSPRLPLSHRHAYARGSIVLTCLREERNLEPSLSLAGRWVLNVFHLRATGLLLAEATRRVG
jgi:hypothetical protein